MTLVPFQDGVWLDTHPVNIVGMPLTSTMTVLRLEDGTLLVHSPVALTPERRAEIDAIGRPAHLYAPNTFHHMHIDGWIAAYPTAKIHAPAELRKKRPELRIDRAHDEARDASLAGVIDEVPIRGFRLRETTLVHLPSRTLVVTDLFHNVGRPTHAWTRFYTTAMGFYDRVALSRMLRWLAFDDRRAARRSVDALLAHDIAHVVVGHGAPIADRGHEALVEGTIWMPPARPELPSGEPKRGMTFSGQPCG